MRASVGENEVGMGTLRNFAATIALAAAIPQWAISQLPDSFTVLAIPDLRRSECRSRWLTHISWGLRE
jgi:hypothetical protein